MMDFGKMLGDEEEAMKRFGNTVVVWDLHTKKPKKVLDVPGAPLEVRCAWQPNHDWCLTTTALTSKLYKIYEDDNGEWQAKAVADIGDASKIPLPVDISITSDDQGLWVNTFMDGKTRYFDISNVDKPVQTYEKVIGKQVNMVSSSWDGTREYYTSSLLGNWDKKGDAGEQYFKAYSWNGKNLELKFEIDFLEMKLGMAHQMRFGAYSLYSKAEPDGPSVKLADVKLEN